MSTITSISITKVPAPTSAPSDSNTLSDTCTAAATSTQSDIHTYVDTYVASAVGNPSDTSTAPETKAASAHTALLTMLLSIAAWLRRTWQTARRRVGNDRAMSTIEYALGCVAAAGLGALLYTVVTGDDVAGALSDIFTRALETK